MDEKQLKIIAKETPFRSKKTKQIGMQKKNYSKRERKERYSSDNSSNMVNPKVHECQAVPVTPENFFKHPEGKNDKNSVKY